MHIHDPGDFPRGTWRVLCPPSEFPWSPNLYRPPRDDQWATAGMIGSIVSLVEGRRRCCKSESYPKFHNPDGRSLVPEQIWEGLQKEFIGNYNTHKKTLKQNKTKKRSKWVLLEHSSPFLKKKKLSSNLCCKSNKGRGKPNFKKTEIKTTYLLFSFSHALKIWKCDSLYLIISLQPITFSIIDKWITFDDLSQIDGNMPSNACSKVNWWCVVGNDMN